MSTLRKAAQQALDALYDIDATGVPVGHIDAVIDTLKAALAQQEQDTATDRVAFERHAESLGYSVDPDTRAGREGGYWSSHTHLMWETWQAALAQQEQEPSVCARCGGLVYDPVWVAQSDPPRREWRGLTEEEVNALWASHDKTGEQITRAIEAALKERNT